MNRQVAVFGLLVGLCMVVSTAWAQGVGLLYPVAYNRYGPVYYSDTAADGSVTSGGLGVGYTTTPAPYQAAPADPLTYRVPTCPPPTVSYQPVVPVWPATCYLARPVVVPCAATYVTYSPTPVAAYSVPVYPTAMPVSTGPRMIVRQKVEWVEGQPVRNLLRAILP